MNKFNQTTPPIPQPTQPNYADRQFMHTFLAGAFLPLVQATITAVMAGVGTLITLYLFGAIDLLKPALIVTAVVEVFTWLYLQRRWLNLTSFENFIGVDLNGDGRIGTPVREPEVVRVQIDELSSEGHIRQMRFADLPISKAKLTTLARGLLAGRPFSEREWTGAGKILSSNEFRTLRSMMLKRELMEMASEKDHRQGFALTVQGWAVMEKLANPTPQVPRYGGREREGDQPMERDFTDDELEAIRNEMARNEDQYQ